VHLFVESKSEWVSGFYRRRMRKPDSGPRYSQESYDRRISQYSRSICLSVRKDVVDDDDTAAAPFGVVSLLKETEVFSVELVFVPVVLSEGLVQSTLTFGRQDVAWDSLNSLVAGGKDL